MCHAFRVVGEARPVIAVLGELLDARVGVFVTAWFMSSPNPTFSHNSFMSPVMLYHELMPLPSGWAPEIWKPERPA